MNALSFPSTGFMHMEDTLATTSVTLLRARGERPGCRRAAEKCDELAPV